MKKQATVAHKSVRSLDLVVRTGTWPEHHDPSLTGQIADHFVERDDLHFAGIHLILDFRGAKKLDDLKSMEQALRECVTQCGATLLHTRLHHFTPIGGISGVAVPAEFRISYSASTAGAHAHPQSPGHLPACVNVITETSWMPATNIAGIHDVSANITNLKIRRSIDEKS